MNFLKDPIILGIIVAATLYGYLYWEAQKKAELDKTTPQKINYYIPIPSPLLLIIIATLISYSYDLHSTYSTDIIGSIPHGLPSFHKT